MKYNIIFLFAILSIGACKSRKQKSVNTEPDKTTSIENTEYKDPKWVDSSNIFLVEINEDVLTYLNNNLIKIKDDGFHVIALNDVFYGISTQNDSLNPFNNYDKINPKFSTEEQFLTLSNKVRDLNLKLIVRLESKFLKKLNPNNKTDKNQLIKLVKCLNYMVKTYNISGFYSSNSITEDCRKYLFEKLENKNLLINNEYFGVIVKEEEFKILNGNRYSEFPLIPYIKNSFSSNEISRPIKFHNYYNEEKNEFNFILTTCIMPNVKVSDLSHTTNTKLLNNLITNNSCLWTGEKAGKYQKLNNIVSNQENVICYKRFNESNEVIFIINLSNKPAEAGFVDLENYTNLTEYFSGKKYDDLLSIDLKPMEYLVFVKK